jgi:ABC-2 type transport system permease protein
LDTAGGMPEMSQQQPIIRELKKHYEVIDVSPNEKIVDADDSDAERYDVLLVVQPSSLTPPQLKNVEDAIMSGIPTAIFEDPFPFWMQNVPGTDQPKRPRQQMMMMMQQPPEEKGNVDATLFTKLGIRMLGDRFQKDEEDFARMARGRPVDYESLIVWQKYNPYPTLRFSEGLTNEWVFVNDSAPRTVDKEGNGCFSDDPITSGLYELLYLFPGGVIERQGKNPALKFTPLVRTGEESGTIRYRHIEEAFRSRTPFMMREHEVSKPARHCLAARVQGEVELPAAVVPDADNPDADNPEEDEPADEKKAAAAKKGKVNVIVVADIDMLHSEFFRLRANPIPGLDLQFQNVPFVLNVIDSLAGEEDFLQIRKGRQMYGHLTRVEQAVAEVVTSEIESQIEDAETEYKRIEEDAEKTREEAISTAQKQFEELKAKGEVSFSAVKTLEDRANMTRDMATINEAIAKSQAEKKFKQDREKAIEEGKRRTYALNDTYKLIAAVVPPILPILAGFIVFFYRRSREQEGVAKSRLR